MPLLTVVCSRDQLLEMQQAKRRVNYLISQALTDSATYPIKKDTQKAQYTP